MGSGWRRTAARRYASTIAFPAPPSMPEDTPLPARAFRFDRFELRPAARLLLADGAPVKLGGRAFDTLVALVERRDRVVSKHELMDAVWPKLVVEENNLQVQVMALRKVMGPAAIATVPGRGYRITLPVAPTGPTGPVPATAAASAAAAPATTHQVRFAGTGARSHGAPGHATRPLTGSRCAGAAATRCPAAAAGSR